VRPQDIGARRAQRQANAKLSRPLRHAVSDDAEDPHQRERERHGREDAKQDGEEPLAAVLRIALDGFAEGKGAVERRDAVRYLLVRCDGCDRGADGVQAGERVGLGADEDLHEGLHQGGVGKVDGGDDGTINAVVAGIADDTDDLTPGGALRRSDLIAIPRCEIGNAQLPAHGIRRGEIARCESVIDDGYEVSAGVFIRIPHATLQQRDAECGDILLTDEYDTGLLLLALIGSVDVERMVIIGINIGRCGIGAGSDSGNTGDGCDLLPELLDVSGAPFAGLNAAPLVRIVSVQLNADLHDIGGIVAKGHLREPQKAADGSAGSGHQKKRERDLRGDENAPATPCRGSDHASLPARESARWIVARETQCGDKTEQEAADEREPDGEREDGTTDTDDGFGGKRIRRQQQGKPCKPVRRSHTQDGAGAGDNQSFDEQLADDAPAAGADGGANGEFRLARAATGQQKDGAVGAANDEQKNDTGQQKRERTP
jgi:hypothetical protein